MSDENNEIDNNEKWRRMVIAARAAKVPIGLEVEFTDESDQPGRRLRLWYDPVTDKEGGQYLDS